jgi:hypothetical protein
MVILNKKLILSYKTGGYYENQNSKKNIINVFISCVVFGVGI